jgi:hypothetical protein
MKARIVVLIKFNKTDKDHPMYKGMRFKKTLARPEWWENRLKIMQEIVIPSLKKQLNQNFDIVAPFSTDIDPELCRPMQEYLDSENVHVCWDDRKLKDFVEPVSTLKDLYYKSENDAIILVNHDSDDIYHPHAFSDIASVAPKKGQVYIFRNGYVYDRPTKRLAHYHGGGSPPPFYAMTFTREALKSQAAWDVYCSRYGLKVEHPYLDRGKVKVDMPNGRFLYLFHGYNVTSSWDNPHHIAKIQQLITGDRKSDLLTEFSVV